MKCVLTVGDCSFIAPDAVSAAKVADLLGAMTPVESKREWLEGSKSFTGLLLEVPRYRREVLIAQHDASLPVFKTREEWEAAAKLAADAAREGGAK